MVFFLGYFFVELKVSIFVGNLPFRAEREDVLQLFVPFGEVLNCSLPLERDTGRKKFAFVEMADEAIELTAIDGLQGTELMGRPLRINKAEPRGSGGSRRGGRGATVAVIIIVVATVAAIIAVATVVATVVVILVVATVAVIIAVVTVVATVVAIIIVVATVVAMVVAVRIYNLRTNLLAQKAGKTEVMVIRQKTLNMKVVEAGEKEFLTRIMPQMKKLVPIDLSRK